MTTAAAIAEVRRLLQDGLNGDATPTPYNVVRMEDLTDQVPAAATPTQRTFMVRFTGVPTEAYVTCFVIPGTLAAYLDGSVVPGTVTSDVNANGNFTLQTAPVTSLQVSYGYQFFTDTDVASLLGQAVSWLTYATADSVPDALSPAMNHFAGALGLRALGRKHTLASARGGDAEMDFGQLARAFERAAEKMFAEAEKMRDDFYAGSGTRLAPTGSVDGLAIAPYQPLQ